MSHRVHHRWGLILYPSSSSVSSCFIPPVSPLALPDFPVIVTPLCFIIWCVDFPKWVGLAGPAIDADPLGYLHIGAEEIFCGCYIFFLLRAPFSRRFGAEGRPEKISLVFKEGVGAGFFESGRMGVGM